MNKAPPLFALLILLLLSLSLAISIGTVHLAWLDIIHGLLQPRHTLAGRIIWQIRLPRALAAMTTGGLLAISGALLQILLRNPLAEPYVLGISGGAACAYLLAILLGLSAVLLPVMSFAGALIASVLVLLLSACQRQFSPLRLLLTGIILAAGWGAVNSLLLVMMPERQLHGILFWLIGDLQTQGMPWLGIIVFVIGLIASILLAPALNILARGQWVAQSLGLAVKQVQILIYCLAALLTAVAVTQAGTVGFVGLIIPQCLRLMIGNDQRLLLPAAGLLGGAFLVLADCLARSLIAPQELPIGVVTALLGVPVFLLLLLRNKGNNIQC